MYVNGKKTGIFEYISDSCFIGKDNKFAFLKYNDMKNSLCSKVTSDSLNFGSVSLIIDKKVACEWPMIASDTLVFSKTGRDYAFIGNYYCIADEQSKWALVLNGRVVWEFDRLTPEFCYFFDVYPIFFNQSDTILFCAGIKNEELILFRYCI